MAIVTVTPSPNANGRSAHGSFTENSFDGGKPLLRARKGLSDGARKSVTKRTSKVKSLISLFSNNKGTSNNNNNNSDIATKTGNMSTVTGCFVKKLTDDSSPFKTDSGTPFAPNQEHKSSWMPLNPIEISFDLAIDTILDVSDDIINLTIEDACSGVGLSPIIRKDDSPIRFEEQCQDAISKAEDALVRLEEQEDYTTLIRGMERAPTTSHSPARRLEFFDENESMTSVKKRVSIQDSKNTVRYFSRSKEEQEFVGRMLVSKKTKPPDASLCYSQPLPDNPPLPESPVKPRYAEDDIVGAMADTVTDAGRKVRAGMVTKMDQFMKWAENLEESSSKFKVTLGQQSNQLKKSFQALSNDAICTSSPHTSMDSQYGDPMELPIDDHPCLDDQNSPVDKGKPGEFLERCLSEPVPLPTKATIIDIPSFNVGVGVLPKLDQEIFHLKHTILDVSADSNQSFERSFSAPLPMAWRNDAQSVVSVAESEASTEVLMRSNGKIVMAEQDSDLVRRCQAIKLQKVVLNRKLSVVNGARRWNKAQQSPPMARSDLDVFFEAEERRDSSFINQPVFDDSSFGDPPTPTSSNRRLQRRRSSEKAATFRKAPKGFKMMWGSPVSVSAAEF